MTDLEQTATAPLQELSRERFHDLTMRLIQTACDGTVAKDAICATVEALGALIFEAGQRDGVSGDDVLRDCLESVTREVFSHRMIAFQARIGSPYQSAL
jgi:hypothetical protein